jgi:hypothetical protein
VRPGLAKIVTLQLGEALKRSWWTVVAGCCIGMIAALLLLRAVPERYEAVASVRVHEAETHGSAAIGDRQRRGGKEPEAGALGLMLDERALAEVADHVFGPSSSETQSEERVRALRTGLLAVQKGSGAGEGERIEIRFRDEDAERSAQIVNAVAQTCAQGITSPSRQEDSVDGVLGLPSRFECEVVEPAVVPAAPLARRRIPLIVLGALAGCLVFVGPVLTRCYLRPVICSATGLLSLSALPLMARIPTIPTPGAKRACTRRCIKNVGLSALSVAALGAALWSLL